MKAFKGYRSFFWLGRPKQAHKLKDRQKRDVWTELTEYISIIYNNKQHFTVSLICDMKMKYAAEVSISLADGSLQTTIRRWKMKNEIRTKATTKIRTTSATMVEGAKRKTSIPTLRDFYFLIHLAVHYAVFRTFWRKKWKFIPIYS